MNTDEYVEDLLEERVMRKTSDPELIEDMYKKKYSNWFINYFRKYGIDDVPLLICCNTLYKLPATIKIQEITFFVGDISLFEYFYDLNYILSDRSKKEYLVNICIKLYIEACYLQDHIDKAFYLDLTSPTLEEYKKGTDYNNENIHTLWTKRTDIQEQFVFLHEANHYFLEQLDQKSRLQEYKNFYNYFQEKTQKKLDIFKENYKTDNLLVECFCDCEALKYMVNSFDQSNVAGFSEFISLMYKVPIYLYILQFINDSVQENYNIENGYSYIFYALSYRMGMLYYVFSKYLPESCWKINEKIFDDNVRILKVIMKKVRQIILYVKEIVDKNLSDIAWISSEGQNNYLKDFLNLL